MENVTREVHLGTDDNKNAMHATSHAQKYFKLIEANKKGNKTTREKSSVLHITGVDAEMGYNSEVPITMDMIGPACEGSQAMLDTSRWQQ